MRRITSTARRIAALMLILLLCLQLTPQTSAAQTAAGGAFANSDVEANLLDCYYELDPNSGVLLRRDADTLQATAVTEEPVLQMALLGENLFLQTADRLLCMDTASGAVQTLRRLPQTVTRFAVTERYVYYLADETIRRSAYDGSSDRLILRETNLNRFWLADADTLEYMTDTETIRQLGLSDGSRSSRKNETSSLTGDLRGTLGYYGLQAKFPAGAYWNHCGGPNNPDGWTYEPCTHHGYHGSGCSVYPNGCNCNSFHESIQCYGFGYKLAYDYYGSTPDEWDNRIWWHPTDGIKAGDVFRYKNNRHTIWITAVNGDTVTYADCNYDGTCVIRWNQTISISTLKSTASFRDIAPARMVSGGDLPEPNASIEQGPYYDDCSVTFTWERDYHATGYKLEIVKDGQTLEQTSTHECSYTLQKPEQGAYTVKIRSYDDYGSSPAATLSFSVIHVERDTRLALWVSLEYGGEPAAELLAGHSAWLCWRIYDATTGQGWDVYGSGGEVALEARAPDGAALCEQTLSAAQGVVRILPEQVGSYTFTAVGAALQTEVSVPSRAATCADVGHSWGVWNAVSDGTEIETTCQSCGSALRLRLGQTACEGGEDCPGSAFADMPAQDNWAHEGIDFLLCNGIMNGVSATSIAPDTVMNRAMLVTLLWRMSGCPSIFRGAQFADVPAGEYYAQAVAWASENGVVNGVSERGFSPLSPVTREQLATILYRLALRRGIAEDVPRELPEFPDSVEVSDYAHDAIAWAVECGLLRGTEIDGVTLLCPKKSATRAQIAAILYRFCSIMEEEG